MGNEKKQPSTEGSNRAREPASGPLSKELGNDLKMIVARLKMRTQGLSAVELDEEIARFKAQLVEKQLRSPLVSEAARPRLRELLESQLDEDPTLQALFADLRGGLARR